MIDDQLQKLHRCIIDDTTMKSLHFLTRQKIKGKAVGKWNKSGMKICSKCGLIMFFNKGIKYIVFPNNAKGDVKKIEY